MGSTNRMTRTGGWFLTFSGHQFWPCDPRAGDVHLIDIAHGLAHICRFGGQCTSFYSVAEHSLLVAALLPVELELLGLMHDATEAYIGDMITPLKRSIPRFKEIEARLWEVIVERFGLVDALDPEAMAEVKRADTIALLTERRDIINRGRDSLDWREDEMGLKPAPGLRARGYSPGTAKHEWLSAVKLHGLTE